MKKYRITETARTKMVDILKEANYQIDDKLRFGFHRNLKMSEDRYRYDFQEAIEQALVTGIPSETARLTLVDPRIPFMQQASLRGFKISDKVLYEPIHGLTDKPHAVWVDIFPDVDGLLPRDRMSAITDPMRIATALEGISCDEEIIKKGIYIDGKLVKQGVCLAVGGDFKYSKASIGLPKSKSWITTIERHLTGIQVEERPADVNDSSISVLAVYR